jgi:hypothetical protein
MLTSTIVLDDSAGNDVTFVLVSQDANGTRRLDQASNLAAPHTMVVRHTVQGAGAAATDRHLVQFEKVIVPSGQSPVKLTVNFTVAVPRNSAVTSQHVVDEIFHLMDFLSSGALTTLASTANIDSIIRGES